MLPRGDGEAVQGWLPAVVRRCVPMPYPHRGQLDSQRPARLGEPVGRGAGGLHLPTGSLRRAARRPGERRPGIAVGGAAVPDDRRHIDVPLARSRSWRRRARRRLPRRSPSLRRPAAHVLARWLRPLPSRSDHRWSTLRAQSWRKIIALALPKSKPQVPPPDRRSTTLRSPRRWSAHQRGDAGAEPTPLNQLAPPPIARRAATSRRPGVLQVQASGAITASSPTSHLGLPAEGRPGPHPTHRVVAP